MKVEPQPDFDAEGQDIQVLVFYSSRSQPGIVDLYQEAIDYLRKSSVDLTIYDIAGQDGRMEAKEHGVVSTPSVVVVKGSEEQRHLGVIDGLKDVLEEDLYGRSILHRMAFREGRTFASSLTDAASPDHIADVLNRELGGEGVESATLHSIDREEPTAEVTIRYDEDLTKDSRTHAHMQMILGGFFTNLFDTGVSATETECRLGEESRCTYVIGGE